MSMTPLASTLGKAISNNPFADDGGSSSNVSSSNSGPSFGDVLTTAFNNVNAIQVNAGDQAKAFALGQVSDIHNVMIAGQKATVALDLAIQVRNKVIDAYQEVMKISM